MIEAYGQHVLILEDEPRLGTRVAGALARQGVSVESVLTRDDCLSRIASDRCDLLVVDANGCAEPNMELLAALKHRYPPVPSLVLVDRGDIAAAVRAVKAGAADCLERPIENSRLCASIQTMLRPKRPLCPPIENRLTDIEIEVLRQVAAGKTNKAIGVALHRSTRTIEVHRRNLARKLGASGIVNLLNRAAALGLIDLV
jgi:two-component system response regulator FixJ